MRPHPLLVPFLLLGCRHDLVVAGTGIDSGDDTSGVISCYATGRDEADCGLGALENGTAFGTEGRQQDIGSSTACSYSDATCRTTYPETVFFWVR